MSKFFGGRYEVIDRIGAGGMAIVYKAKDVLLNRIVTVKVLREQFLSDEEFVRRFRREAQAAASLSHPNIVSIYDVGKDGEIEYIVMEYVEGRNLKEIIREYAPLSPEQAINLSAQIGEAISHAHEHHIIHRDIKPHNVLVTEDGRAKVTDFGIARAVSSATVTHTGDIVGSVHYLSPEQARGLQSDERSDLYSLGIILYELLTGKVPYDGETPIAIALKHLQEAAPLPSKINPRVSRDLENVVIKATAKSAEQRYGSAKEFLDDLAKVRAGQPVNAGAPFDLEATQVHGSLRAAAEAVSEGKSEVGDAPLAGKAGGRKKRWLWLGIALAVLLLLGGGGLWLKSYLSVGMTKVPDLKGMTLMDATVALQKAKLNWGAANANSSEFSDTIPKDQIIDQAPKAQAQVKIGREVTVVVSKGPEILSFPNLKGANPPLTEEAAKNLIANQGFTGKVKVDTAPSATVANGYVMEQDPAAGAQWTKNGAVHLTISSGPQFQIINMPDVISKSVGEARNILETQNKLIMLVEVKNSTLYPPDMVIDSNPKPNQQVQQGAKVTVTISNGPGPLAKQMDQQVIVGSLQRVVPNDGKVHDVSVRINDTQGETEVWHSPYRAGTVAGVPADIRYYPPATLQILVDGALQYENRYS